MATVQFFMRSTWILSLLAGCCLSAPLQAKSSTSKSKITKGKIAKSWFSFASADTSEEKKQSLHSIDNIHEKNKTFEIESKARFQVSDTASIQLVKGWMSNNASIRIFPNESWTSSHAFVIKNTATEESIEATLIRMPVEREPHNRRISNINHATHEIALSQVKEINGQTYVTTWKYQIGPSWQEQEFLRSMLVGDLILVGDNVRPLFRSSDFAFILIDTTVKLDYYVTAKLLESSTVLTNNR